MNHADFLRTLNGDGLVEARWPYDGPHSPDTVREAAQAVAAAVRYLNNATGPGNGQATLGYAPQLYRLLGSVTGTVGGMDQLLRQLDNAAGRHAADDTLYDDRRDRPGSRTAVEVAVTLAEARETLSHVYRALNHACYLAAHLGHDLSDESERDTP